jgi:hypothetical protein
MGEDDRHDQRSGPAAPVHEFQAPTVSEVRPEVRRSRREQRPPKLADESDGYARPDVSSSEDPSCDPARRDEHTA